MWVFIGSTLFELFSKRNVNYDIKLRTIDRFRGKLSRFCAIKRNKIRFSDIIIKLYQWIWIAAAFARTLYLTVLNFLPFSLLVWLIVWMNWMHLWAKKKHQSFNQRYQQKLNKMRKNVLVNFLFFFFFYSDDSDYFEINKDLLIPILLSVSLQGRITTNFKKTAWISHETDKS